MLCNTGVKSTSRVVMELITWIMGNTPKILEAGAPGFSQVKKSRGSETITFTAGLKSLNYSQIKYYPGEMAVIMPCPRSMQLSYTGIVYAING